MGAVWAFAALLAPAWYLTRRERSWGAHALTQLGAQQAVHAALSLSAGALRARPARPDGLRPPGGGRAEPGCWLRCGERRAWAAARRLVGGVLTGVSRRPCARPPRSPWSYRPPRTRPPAFELRHALARRGPPPRAAASTCSPPRPVDPGLPGTATPDLHTTARGTDAAPATPPRWAGLPFSRRPPRTSHRAARVPLPAPETSHDHDRQSLRHRPHAAPGLWAQLRPLVLRLHFYAGIFVAPFLLVVALTGFPGVRPSPRS